MDGLNFDELYEAGMIFSHTPDKLAKTFLSWSKKHEGSVVSIDDVTLRQIKNSSLNYYDDDSRIIAVLKDVVIIGSQFVHINGQHYDIVLDELLLTYPSHKPLYCRLQK